MTRTNHTLRFFIIFCLVFSMMPYGSVVRAQDIIASDEISGGSSVFVFRQSRKKPQERSARSQAFAARGAAGHIGRRRVNAYVASHAHKKRTPSLVKNTAAAQAAAL